MDDQGLERSAILLMTLGEEAAAEVFRHLSPKEVQKIGETMTRLRTVPREKVDQVLEQFQAEAEQNGSLVADTDEYVKAVLRKALGEEKAGLLINRILQGSDTSGIESLKWMDSESVAELIRNEHPQIIASILVHLERDHAGEILSRLSHRIRADVVQRVATLDGIQPNALKELNEVLSRVLAGADKLKKAALGGPKVAAEMINGLGTSLETEVLEAVRETDEDLAQAIQDQMFTFDDLLKLDDRAVQAVLREVSNDALVIALKGATPEIRDKILKNMSQRAAEALREDLESRGPVRVSDVETQQKEILKTIRRLADAGEIAMASGSEDAFV
ncbi:MAG TPA: flagellar motor switch protein FliG, partial [Burkholderiaceae bacterium]|nr:flagellar motor switch protein FliG [Burkholderiaceae bacterium]